MQPLTHDQHVSPISVEHGPNGTMLLWFTNETNAVAYVHEVWEELRYQMDSGDLPRGRTDRYIVRVPVLDRSSDTADRFAVAARKIDP